MEGKTEKMEGERKREEKDEGREGEKGRDLTGACPRTDNAAWLRA